MTMAKDRKGTQSTKAPRWGGGALKENTKEKQPKNMKWREGGKQAHRKGKKQMVNK